MATAPKFQWPPLSERDIKMDELVRRLNIKFPEIARALAASGGAVSSVFGRTGAVVAVAGDYSETKGGTGQTSYTLGDILYASAANTLAKLAGNTTATRNFLRQLGTGSVSAAPAWDTLAAGDIPNLDASKIATGVLNVGRIPAIEDTYYSAHVQGGSGITPWYAFGSTNNSAYATVAVVANTLYGVPFVAPARPGITLDRIAFNVTTLLAGNGRCGIYDATSDTNIYPNALIVDGGSLSTGTTGVKSTTISQALTPGKLYWAVYVGDAAATLRAHQGGTATMILGTASSLPVNPFRDLEVAFTFAALPSTFPASGTLTTNNPPVVFGRYSA